VGAKGQVSYPPNATVINLNGRTILPGLIDGHVHLKEYQLPMFMPYGVTTIADIHNDTAWILAQREALKSGRINGPRMFVSGARVSGPLGTATPESTIVRTVDEARAYVRRLVAAGVDLIKVDLTITDDQLRAVIEEANAAGLRVVGHTQNIRRAAEMGFKHMEHTDTMARALLDPEGNADPRLFPPCCRPVALPAVAPERDVDPKLFPPLIKYLVGQGVYVNPTMVLTWGAATPRWRDWKTDATQLLKDPSLAFVPANVRQLWTQPPGQGRDGYKNAAEFLRTYSEAGGKVLAATDTGCCDEIIPGLSLHYEMQMLTDAGITPMKAIQGATLWAAEVIGQSKDLGSIQSGKIADFTVIEGNPLADIAATRNVRMVIKAGKVMDTKYDPRWVNPIPRPSARAPQIPNR
jgi:imidazolonepropionase-like amidohydrolase